MRRIKIGDVLYSPLENAIVEVVCFGTDKTGQRAIGYKIGKRSFHSSAWIVFKYYAKLGRV